jgi:hypothetical protein
MMPPTADLDGAADIQEEAPPYVTDVVAEKRC